MKFIEAQLKSAITDLLGVEGNPRVLCEAIERHPKEILTKQRDTHLPKLISRNLNASEIEQLTTTI